MHFLYAMSWVRVNPTTDAKSQWSKTSKKIREERFEEVVTTVNDILITRDICVKYIGFD
jgi:ATP-dependent phosphoenolpyruvate carboxykinase